jgi:hypothetical protein
VETAPLRRPGTAATAALLLLVLLALHVDQELRRAAQFDGIDFYQFWAIGLAANAQDLDVYDPAERGRLGEWLHRRSQRADASPLERAVGPRRRALEVFSTPFLYAVFGLAASGDYAADLARFQVASLAAALAGVALLCRQLGYGWSATALAALAVVFWGVPFASDAQAGNVNRLQLGALALCLWLGSPRAAPAWRDALGGLGLALLVAFKPNLALVPALLAAAWAGDGRRRKLAAQAAGFGAGAAAAVAIAAARFGAPGAWLDWIGAIRSLTAGADRRALSAGNTSLAQWLAEASGRDPVAALSLGLVALALASLWLGRGSGPAGAQRDVLVAGLAGAIGLLAAPVVWIHYYVLATPLLLFGLRPGAGAPERFVALLSLALVSPILFDPGGGLDAVRARLVAATLALLVLGLAEPWRRGAALERAAG